MNDVSPRPRILIAEDEMILAMMLEDLLGDAGYQVIKAARVPAALALVASEAIDVAILDVNLAGKDVFPVADALRERDIPMVFASGYGHNGLPQEYRDFPMLQKPYVAQLLLDVLGGMLSRSTQQS